MIFKHPISSLFVAFSLLVSTANAADTGADVRNISLISTSGYDPRKEEGRGFNAFFSGVGVSVFGPNMDLQKAIQERMDQDELREYFPSAAERASISRKVASDTKRLYLSQEYNNKNVIAAIRYATTEVITKITKRVMENKGLKDPSRAALWSAKVLAPYQHCMDIARSYQEGKKCAHPLEADLTKNLGLATAYELTRQEFGDQYAKARPAEYVKCLRTNEPGSADRVSTCATNGVRKASSEYGRARIMAVALKSMSQASATKITSRVIPDFNKCLNAVSDRAGFVKCADKLIGSAGSEIASETIRLDSRVTSYFPNPKDRERIAVAGRDAFVKCMAENVRDNRRDSSGTLTTDNCENFVKLETVHTVALEVMRVTLESNLNNLPAAEREKAQRKVKDQLASCWDSKKTELKNGECLRSVAKQAAIDIARERLSKEVPEELVAKEPKLREQLLTGFGACMEQRLPRNLLEASNSDLGIEGCVKGIVKDVAVRVAELRVRKALEGQVPKGELADAIVSSLVTSDFTKCLGDAPTDAILTQCTLRLQKNVASQAAKALLPARVDDFFNAQGGVQAYGISEEQKAAIVAAVLEAHDTCLKTEVKSKDTDQSELEINSCLKKTIRNLSLQLGPLELARTTRASGVEASPELKESFKKDFATCLDQKKDSKFSFTDYMQGLQDCQVQLTRDYTIRLAKSELTKAVKQIFPDEASAAKAKDLEKKIIENFDGCLANAKDSAGRDVCISSLKSDATIELAREGVRSNAMKSLNASAPPPAIVDLEIKLDRCVKENKKGGEECALAHVKASTKVIGNLVLRSRLKDAMEEKKLAKLEPEILKLQEPFNKCVDEAPGPLAQAFLDKIDECSNRLTEKAVEFVMGQLAQKPPSKPPLPIPPSKPAQEGELTEEQLTDMVTRAFLCLNGALAPENEQAIKNIKPGGIEAQLMQLVASYVNYDLKAAHGQIAPVMARLAEDLKAAGSPEARKNLIDELVKQGMVDQLLKSIARSDIEDKMKNLSPKVLSPDLRQKILDRKNIDKALNAEVMTKLRPILAEGVLKPILVDGKSGFSVGIIWSYTSARSQAVEAIISNPDIAPDEATRKLIRNALK